MPSEQPQTPDDTFYSQAVLFVNVKGKKAGSVCHDLCEKGICPVRVLAVGPESLQALYPSKNSRAVIDTLARYGFEPRLSE